MIAVPDILQIGEQGRYLKLTYKKEGFDSDMRPEWELQEQEERKTDVSVIEDAIEGEIEAQEALTQLKRMLDKKELSILAHQRKMRLIRDLNLEELGRICSEERVQTWNGEEVLHRERFSRGFGYILAHPLPDEGSVAAHRLAVHELMSKERKATLDTLIEQMYELGAQNQQIDDGPIFDSVRKRIDRRLKFLGNYHSVLSKLEDLCEGIEATPLRSIRDYVQELRRTKGGEFVPTAVERAENHLTLNLEITHSAGRETHSLRFTKSRYGSRVPGIRILKHLGHKIKAAALFMFPYRWKVDSALKNLIRANRQDIEGTLSLLPTLEFYRCVVNYEKRLRNHEQDVGEPQVSLDGTTIAGLKHPITSLGGDGVVPNDYRASSDARMLLVTGANNGGKTFYSKAVGLTQLLFQRGLSIPAREARVGMVDNVYTHFVDQDDPIHKEGRYRFELRRMCEILDNCTNRSLVIVDEPCSGTEPEMGQTQSSYFLEALAETGARVIFNTHYHGLATLRIPAMRNIHPDTRFEGGKLHYNYKMLDGPAGTSYALEVAQAMDLGRDALLAKARKARNGD